MGAFPVSGFPAVLARFRLAGLRRGRLTLKPVDAGGF
jgi:hypothetical protein